MKTDVANRFIWYKGQIINVNDAKVNVLSPTSQFGLNVFEGIPGLWNCEQKQLYAFRLEDHYRRLQKSAKLIQIDCKFSMSDLKKALIDVVRANEYDENLSVRQTLFVDGFGSWSSDGPVEMFVAPIPRGRTSAEYNKKGLNCCVTSWRRISDENLSPRIKCGANYINSRVGQSLDESLAQAESVKQAVVEEAKRQAEQIVQQARRTAENEGRAMLAEVRAAIADEIVDAAEKVLAEKLTAAEHEKLITNSLNKVVLH